jgi:hypothetical protein
MAREILTAGLYRNDPVFWVYRNDVDEPEQVLPYAELAGMRVEPLDDTADPALLAHRLERSLCWG